MRFSSPSLAPAHPATDLRNSILGRFWMTALMVGGMLLIWLGSSTASGQQPGTLPPRQAFESSDGDPEGLPVRAFIYLSESGNQVIMPGMTWEEFQRLLDLDAGLDGQRQSFSYQSLEITGSAERERAELEVVLRLSIEPTEGRWVSIPLRMKNFHRLAPPDVTGVDEYFMALGTEEEAGYRLFVKANKPSEAMLRMRVSARIDRLAAAQTLAFHLPDVPSKVELSTGAPSMLGEVIGRGDETIRKQATAGGQTRFVIESGGGDFSVRWGNLSRASDDLQLLEVESRVNVRWDSPQDQPIATVQLTIRNLRGSIRAFPLRLPRGSVVLEPPTLGTGGIAIELDDATSEDEIREVVIPEEEQQQRIDLNFKLQLSNDNASASSPLAFRVPDVIGALRHRGEIEIEAGGDYRLRWRSKPWVRGELGESREEGAAGRVYTFRFDRASFELPLWLGEKERQLRMVSQSQITVREAMASLEMTIQVNGQTSDGRLQFDDGGWKLNSIESTATGEPLESFLAGPYRIIELDTASSDEAAPIRIRAERALASDQPQVRFGIPRVVEVEDTVVVQSATVNIVNSGRTMLVVDLNESTGLTRVISAGELSSDSPTTRFRVLTQDEPAVVVGKLVDQLPRITLASDTRIELDGRQLRTTVDWIVSSGLDLEGVLPVRIPPSPTAGATETATDVDSQTSLSEAATLSTEAADPSEPVEDWVVTVDGILAELRAQEDDHYVVISPRLASGSMSVRWQRTQTLRSAVTDGLIESVSLPRPDFPDLTVRGAQRVILEGNQAFELTSANSPFPSVMELESLPRDPIRLRLQSKLTTREELSIRQIILRTAVGHNTRYEQVLAEIQGGDQFRVGLPETARDVSVEAYIDGGPPVEVRREDNTLLIALPGDTARHVIDLRVWIAANTPVSFATVQPMLKLPFGAGRVFWQIIAPLDGHVVWASPTLGRSMTWRFDRWKLYREPTYSDRGLNAMISSSLESSTAPGNALIPGNRYLYIGSDVRSFQVVVVSRVILWIVIGSLVLLTAVLLATLPQSRHPLTAVIAAILFGGLLAIAPDAAVLAGQFGMVALVLVIVMLAIRVLITPARSDRVFAASRAVSDSSPSTRSVKQQPEPEPAAVSSTQTMTPPSPTEASS